MQQTDWWKNKHVKTSLKPGLVFGLHPRQSAFSLDTHTLSLTCDSGAFTGSRFVLFYIY